MKDIIDHANMTAQEFFRINEKFIDPAIIRRYHKGLMEMEAEYIERENRLRRELREELLDESLDELVDDIRRVLNGWRNRRIQKQGKQQ